MGQLVGDISKKLAMRDTPAGRQYELKLIFWDSIILCVGCVALAVGILPVVALAAIAHLIVGAMQTVSRIVWLPMTLLTTALWMAVLILLAYVLDWPLFADLSVSGLLATAAYAVVVGGIVSQLFASTLPNSWTTRTHTHSPKRLAKVSRAEAGLIVPTNPFEL